MNKFVPRILTYNKEGVNPNTGGVVDLSAFEVGDIIPIMKEVVIVKDASGLKSCLDKKSENCIECETVCPFNTNPHTRER